MKNLKIIPHLAIASSLFLTACVSPVADSSGRYASPIGGSPVINNNTPYTPALLCLGQRYKNNKKFTVAGVLDYTQKTDFEGGRKVTQGAGLMAMTALSKAGTKLLERLDTSVTDKDLKYANKKLLGDKGNADPYRKVHAGVIQGADYFITGGVTELNHNIKSSGIDGFGNENTRFGPKGMLKAKTYVMNVGLDLRLVNSKTLEVVDAISYQKQIIGHEVGIGAFAFFGGTRIFDVGVGQKGLEPIQLAVRSVMERGVYSLLTTLYKIPESNCFSGVGSEDDYLNSTSKSQNQGSAQSRGQAQVQRQQQAQQQYQAQAQQQYQQIRRYPNNGR